MSKDRFVVRYNAILNKLQAQPYASLTDVKKYVQTKLQAFESWHNQESIVYADRTFQRDIKDIASIWHIHISYCRANKGYFIENAQALNQNLARLMEQFELLNLSQLAGSVQPFVHFEDRPNQYTSYLLTALDAIKRAVQIQITYQKFTTEEAYTRTVEPLALKEFKKRWYLIVNDLKHAQLRTYAVDRIQQLQVTTNRFKRPANFSVHRMFAHTYGITENAQTPPETIVLEFTPLQYQYLASLQLHSSQQLLSQTDTAVRVQFTLHLTYELIMEILSMGKEVKIIAPEKLKNQVTAIYKAALQQYEP